MVAAYKIELLEVIKKIKRNASLIFTRPKFFIKTINKKFYSTRHFHTVIFTYSNINFRFPVGCYYHVICRKSINRFSSPVSAKIELYHLRYCCLIHYLRQIKIRIFFAIFAYKRIKTFIIWYLLY